MKQENVKVMNKYIIQYAAPEGLDIEKAQEWAFDVGMVAYDKAMTQQKCSDFDTDILITGIDSDDELKPTIHVFCESVIDLNEIVEGIENTIQENDGFIVED